MVTFTTCFTEYTFYASFTPFTSYQFNWNSLQVSILYASAGIEVILVFVLLNFITKKFRDETLLLFSLVILTTACLIGVIALPLSEVGTQNFPVVFLLFVIMVYFVQPFIVVAGTSLFIQQTKADQQGFGQGIQRAVVSVAVICSPIYAGLLLGRTWIMLLSLLIIVLIATILLAIAYRSFQPKTTDELSALIPPVNKNIT
jgi:predicted MFS family arabinose efflux permease